MQIKNDYVQIKDNYERLLQINLRLKEEKLRLEKILEDTMALYDVTKEICKSLDEDKVFINFCEEIRNYIEFKDCQFLETKPEALQFKDYIILPLEIQKQEIGYLVIKGIRKEDEDKFNILSQQFILGIKRAHLYRRIEELAVTDSLTGVSSRRHCLERLSQEMERAKKFNYNFSLLMIDIDHFRDYNEHYGHLVADAVLKAVAAAIRQNLRQIDIVGRYGGEEFLVILTETDKKQAVLVAERIRKTIEDKRIRAYDEQLSVTVSVGVAIFPENGQLTQVIIDKADSALYQAKQAGRNRVFTCPVRD